MLHLKNLFTLSAMCLLPLCAQAELHLKDFQGTFISAFFSAGGSPTGSLATARTSDSDIRHLTIDKHGNGVVDFESGIAFLGLSFAPGNATVASTNDNTAPKRSFTIKITDHKKGIGQITLTSADGKSNTVSDFVAIQDSKGRVIKFIQNDLGTIITPGSGSTPGLNGISSARVIVSERQS